ncbi:MAG: hypothetical protein J2O46_06425 [Nocardioides sp.]|nr:hypothetical protein [Nocardioides sp.]
MARTDSWLARTGSRPGPLIPHTAAAEAVSLIDDFGWVPKGLAYAAERHLLIQCYHGDKLGSALTFIDEPTGEEVNAVYLGGPEGSVSGPVDAGGVAVIGDDVYVCEEMGDDHGRLWHYSLSRLLEAPRLSIVFAEGPLMGCAGGSYITADNGLLYVGSRDSGRLFHYRWTEKYGWDLGYPIGVRTPDCVQGVVVRPDEFVFSVSQSRVRPGWLIVQDRVTLRRRAKLRMPNLVEGIAEVDGHILASYSSGATEYARLALLQWGKDWHLPVSQRLWPSPRMTRTPLQALRLSS